MHLSVFAALDWLFWLLTPANWGIVAAVAAGLGFVIFVHELGHFLVAKACGVKCEKFYLGFDIYGLKLAKFQWGETEYGIGILPLGGYVKMLGQDDNPARMAEETRRAQQHAGQSASASDTSTLEDTISRSEHAPPMTHGDLPPEPVSDPHTPYDPRSYMAQSVPKRMAIISAGVIMNVIFAFLMASLAFAIGVTEFPCKVGVVNSGGAAWKADLQPGHEVVRIGTLENPRFRDLQAKVPLSDINEGVEFEVRGPGDEDTVVKRLYPDKSIGVPIIGIGNAMSPRLAKMEPAEEGAEPKPPAAPHSAAARAKPALQGEDRIAKIGDVEIDSYADILKQLAQHSNEELVLTVLRPPEDIREQIEKQAKKSGESLTRNEIEARMDEAAKPVEIVVPPEPVRDIGLVMTMGPISAVQTGSPAEEAGVKAGDVLVAINGEPVGNPLTLPDRMAELAKTNTPLTLTLKRTAEKTGEEEPKTETIQATLTPREPRWFYPSVLVIDPVAVPALGIAYRVYSKVEAIVPDSPAAKADLKPGDVVTRIQFLAPKKAEGDEADGSETKNAAKDSDVLKLDDLKSPAWPSLVFQQMSGGDPDQTIKLWIDRGGKEHTVELKPAIAKLEDGSPWNVPDRGFLLQPETFVQVAGSLGHAFQLGARETVDNLLMVYRFLQRIGQGQISFKMAAGPVGIAQMAGSKVKEGFPAFLLFLTMLSANLAVINFLPIPVLDGGHMVFLLYEGIRGKPASERVIIAFTYAGMLLLLTLMIFVLSLDTGLISRR